MKYILATCTYCNYQWALNSNDDYCIKCSDKNPKLEEKDTRSIVDYYKGSPPFPEKDISDYYCSTKDESKKTWYWDKCLNLKDF